MKTYIALVGKKVVFFNAINVERAREKARTISGDKDLQIREIDEVEDLTLKD